MLKIILRRIFEVVTMPFAIYVLLDSPRINHDYRLYGIKKWMLGLKMFRNTLRIKSGSSYKAHLAIAVKLLELPPPSTLPGVVVECGTWKGASAANISLVCKITGRRLFVFDSFQGLPSDAFMNKSEMGEYSKGDFIGTLLEVRENIKRYGSVDSCTFIEGWFDETLPKFTEPVVIAWLDVDLAHSLEVCVKNLWQRLVDGGYIFTDEAVDLRYVGLFWSESWWKENFGSNPPGLIGSGTGLSLGNFYLGPVEDLKLHSLWHAGSAAYTRKGFVGTWYGQKADA